MVGLPFTTVGILIVIVGAEVRRASPDKVVLLLCIISLAASTKDCIQSHMFAERHDGDTYSSTSTTSPLEMTGAPGALYTSVSTLVTSRSVANGRHSTPPFRSRMLIILFRTVVIPQMDDRGYSGYYSIPYEVEQPIGRVTGSFRVPDVPSAARQVLAGAMKGSLAYRKHSGGGFVGAGRDFTLSVIIDLLPKAPPINHDLQSTGWLWFSSGILIGSPWVLWLRRRWNQVQQTRN